jgi:aldose 1-epimerase
VDALADQRLLLSCATGVCALVSSRGASLVALVIPNRDGRFADVVLGFDTSAEYADHAGIYFGCTVGRVAGRIRRASFTLDGKAYYLAANDGRNHLHGGTERSFDKVNWAAATSSGAGGASVTFTYCSPNMEEGFPGRLDVSVKYLLTRQGDLRIEYEATTDRATPVNLTNHTYWNLTGNPEMSVLDHELEIEAAQYTPTDDELIPTGATVAVEGSPLDFRAPHSMWPGIRELEAMGAGGYDHNLVLTRSRLDADGLAFAGRLQDLGSGRQVEIWTTEPCLQLYSGNFLRPGTGKLGSRYGHRSGVCLEPQGYPAAVNNPGFPSSILQPGVTYRSTTIFRLGTDRS